MKTENRARMKAAMGSSPVRPSFRSLVSRVVVDDEVEIEVARHVGLDVLQEAQELLR